MSGITNYLVFRAREQFTDNVAREHLLNAVCLRLVHKHRHGNGAHAGRQPCGMAAGVIAATVKNSKTNDCRKQKRQRLLHCTFPCGLTAASAVAQSAAVSAARRRLSTAAQSQKPFSWTASRCTATMISSLPATFTLLGESSAVRAICTCSPARLRESCSAETPLASSR